MDTFAALADPTRRRILERLGRGERAAGQFVREFAVTAPAISQHLKVLREAGLVRVRPDRQRRLYSLDPAGWAEVDEWLARMRRFWAGRLDVLARELEQPEPAKPRRKR